MPEGMDLFEAMETQRAIRSFRPDPIPDHLITRLLQAAVKAPTPGAAQDWRFIVIRDEATRRKIGELYRARPAFRNDPNWTPQQRRAYGSAYALGRTYGERAGVHSGLHSGVSRLSQ